MKIQVPSGWVRWHVTARSLAAARINTEGSSDLPEKLGFSTDLSPFGCQLP